MKNQKASVNEAIASLLADGLRAADLSPPQRTALFDRVLARIAAAPPVLTETIQVEAMPWQPVCAGVWTKVLKSDVSASMQIALFRLDPGGVVPAHAHRVDEECLVLEGEILLGEHCVKEGDFHIARAGSQHPDLTTRTGALLLVRSELLSLSPAHG